MVYKKGGCPDFTFYSFFLSEHPVRTPLKNMAPLSFLPDFTCCRSISIRPPGRWSLLLPAHKPAIGRWPAHPSPRGGTARRGAQSVGTATLPFRRTAFHWTQWKGVPTSGQLRTVYNGLDKKLVVLDEAARRTVEHVERREERASAGDVHLGGGLLERGAGRVRAEGVDHVISLVVAEQHQGHLLAERPAQKGVVSASHDDEKNRQVAAFAHPVSVQIDAQAHLVT